MTLVNCVEHIHPLISCVRIVLDHNTIYSAARCRTEVMLSVVLVHENGAPEGIASGSVVPEVIKLNELSLI